MSDDQNNPNAMHDSKDTSQPEASFAPCHGSTAGVAKGDKHGECNRTVCTNTGANWFNKSTRKYYCKPCALQIMRWPENAGLLEMETP